MSKGLKFLYRVGYKLQRHGVVLACKRRRTCTETHTQKDADNERNWDAIDKRRLQKVLACGKQERAWGLHLKFLDDLPAKNQPVNVIPKVRTKGDSNSTMQERANYNYFVSHKLPIYASFQSLITKLSTFWFEAHANTYQSPKMPKLLPSVKVVNF